MFYFLKKFFLVLLLVMLFQDVSLWSAFRDGGDSDQRKIHFAQRVSVISSYTETLANSLVTNASENYSSALSNLLSSANQEYSSLRSKFDALIPFDSDATAEIVEEPVPLDLATQEQIYTSPPRSNALKVLMGSNKDVIPLLKKSRNGTLTFDPIIVKKFPKRKQFSLNIPFTEVGHSQKREISFNFSSEEELNQALDAMELMHYAFSQTFTKASVAMGNLMTDILSSTRPQPYHFIQIDHLASVSSSLKQYLDYHRSMYQKLTSSGALPIDHFLNLSFFPPSQIDTYRSALFDQFKTIKTAADELIRKNYIIDKFIKKIESSILLPTETAFSQEEIDEIFMELGFAVHAEQLEVLLSHDYYFTLYEFSKKLKNLQTLVKNFLGDAYASSEYKEIFEGKEQEILGGNYPLTPFPFNKLAELKNQNILIESQGVKKLLNTLQNMEKPAKPHLPYLDDNFISGIIKSDGNLNCAKAILFLVQKFAPEQFKEAQKRSIIGEVDPALQAAFTDYYGRSLNVIKTQLLNHSDYTFAQQDYKKLKSSERLLFIKMYLDAVMAQQPITLDLADIKSQTLGISDDPIEKLRNMLIIRACEFLNFDALQKDLDIKRVTEVTKKSAYFSNVQVLKALYRYEILNNSLKTEEDKKKF